MGVNSLPKTVTQQHRGCDLNPGPSVPEFSMLIAKCHYTDTDTDPNGPARTQRSFAAKKCVSVSGPCRVRVVEFSSYSTTCADFVRVGSVSGPCPCPCRSYRPNHSATEPSECNAHADDRLMPDPTRKKLLYVASAV